MTSPDKAGRIDDGLVFDGNGQPLPAIIEISVTGACNRACTFCPHGNPSYKPDLGFIPLSIVDQIGRDLDAMGFKGTVIFSGFGEPTLARYLVEYVGRIRQWLPLARLEIVTNGDALNAPRTKALFGAGLDVLFVSVYDGPARAEEMRVFLLGIGLLQEQFVIRDRSDPDSITLTDRGGAVGPRLAHSHTRPCHYPAYMLAIDHTGDVMLCPHDWAKGKVVGNVTSGTLGDIWTSATLVEVRAMLARGDRSAPSCARCDACGDLMGAKHAAAWARAS